jgi:hypothetical protein
VSNVFPNLIFCDEISTTSIIATKNATGKQTLLLFLLKEAVSALIIHHTNMPLRRASYTKFHVGSAFFIGCCVGSLLLTAVHVSHLDQLGDIRSVSSVHHSLKAKHQQQDVILHALEISKKAKHGNTNKQKNIAANHDNEVHPVAGLQCEEHGGPALPKDAQEMVYWRDIPEDNGWTSPFRDITERRYLTFVPDGGGW